jgi:hypothetical protein
MPGGFISQETVDTIEVRLTSNLEGLLFEEQMTETEAGSLAFEDAGGTFQLDFLQITDKGNEGRDDFRALVGLEGHWKRRMVDAIETEPGMLIFRTDALHNAESPPASRGASRIAELGKPFNPVLVVPAADADGKPLDEGKVWPFGADAEVLLDFYYVETDPFNPVTKKITLTQAGNKPYELGYRWRKTESRAVAGDKEREYIAVDANGEVVLITATNEPKTLPEGVKPPPGPPPTDWMLGKGSNQLTIYGFQSRWILRATPKDRAEPAADTTVYEVREFLVRAVNRADLQKLWDDSKTSGLEKGGFIVHHKGEYRFVERPNLSTTPRTMYEFEIAGGSSPTLPIDGVEWDILAIVHTHPEKARPGFSDEDFKLARNRELRPDMVFLVLNIKEGMGIYGATREKVSSGDLGADIIRLHNLNTYLNP